VPWVPVGEDLTSPEERGTVAGISVQAKLTTQDLMAAVEQLEPAEAEMVSRRLLHLQARRKAPHLPEREAELLREVYREKRPGFQERFDELNAKRRAFTLTPEEHGELLQLVEESEAFTARRLEALAELAQLRQLSLPALMKQIGLKAPPVV
jgi:hypothetical protein